jgi:hypothetical protein
MCIKRTTVAHLLLNENVNNILIGPNVYNNENKNKVACICKECWFTSIFKKYFKIYVKKVSLFLEVRII